MAAFDLKLLSPMKPFLSSSLLAIALALPTAAGAQRLDPVQIDDRFNQLQQSITMLTGQIEQLQYRNQQLQQQLEKMQTDYEFRLDQMEKGGGGRPGGAAPRPPAGPAAAPPLAAAAPPAAAGGGAGGEQLYSEAMKKLQDGDNAGAERSFKSYLQANPRGALAGNAQYWLGESYYARRDYPNAMTAFAEGYKVYKSSPKGPDNLLKLGVTLAVMGRKPDACAVFAKFNQDYPRATDLQKRRVDQERQKNGCG
jgi:tol-pal system protein YbgF